MENSTKTTQRRPVMIQVNKWSTRSNTIETELKLVDAEIIMLKTQVKIMLETNDFIKMHEITTILIIAIRKYKQLYSKK